VQQQQQQQRERERERESHAARTILQTPMEILHFSRQSLGQAMPQQQSFWRLFWPQHASPENHATQSRSWLVMLVAPPRKALPLQQWKLLFYIERFKKETGFLSIIIIYINIIS